jgi:hypothetical protein
MAQITTLMSSCVARLWRIDLQNHDNDEALKKNLDKMISISKRCTDRDNTSEDNKYIAG